MRMGFTESSCYSKLGNKTNTVCKVLCALFHQFELVNNLATVIAIWEIAIKSLEMQWTIHKLTMGNLAAFVDKLEYLAST